MKLNRKSWHSRWYKFLTKDYPDYNNFCVYFWSLLFVTLISPFIIPVNYVFLLIEKFNDYLTEYYVKNLTDVQLYLIHEWYFQNWYSHPCDEGFRRPALDAYWKLKKQESSFAERVRAGQAKHRELQQKKSKKSWKKVWITRASLILKRTWEIILILLTIGFGLGCFYSSWSAIPFCGLIVYFVIKHKTRLSKYCPMITWE